MKKSIHFYSTCDSLNKRRSTSFNDSLFEIYDDWDATKKIKFEASSIATGQTRTITMPDKNVNLWAIPETDITFTDITTWNASSTAHWFLPKLDNTWTKYLRDDWIWQTVSWSVNTTQSTFVAWKNITAWNALYISDYDTIVWNTKTAWWTATRFWWTWADPYQVKVAQSFTVASNYTNISKIELSPYKTWTPTDNVIIRIETDNAWSPSWTLVDANATLTITSWELTTSEVIITKTFTPFNLNTWTYWIVYSRSSTLDDTNHYFRWVWSICFICFSRSLIYFKVCIFSISIRSPNTSIIIFN